MGAERIRMRPDLHVAVALLQSADLPTADLTDAHMVDFLYSGPDAVPTGLVGIELCGPQALLRSLVVLPGHRSTGLGARLVAEAEAHARRRGARAVYLLTTTAEPFFRRHGYVAADRGMAPAAIRSTREFADICPASAAFLTKPL